MVGAVLMCACDLEPCPRCAEAEAREWEPTPQDVIDWNNMLAGVGSDWYAGTVCDDA